MKSEITTITVSQPVEDSDKIVDPSLLINKRPKRAVKQVVPFSYEAKESKSRSRKKLENIGQGSGTPLGEIPAVSRNINRLKYNDDVLKGLHKLFYGTVGMKNEIKSNIRRFSGFSNATPVDEIVIKEKLEKWKLIGLKNMCTVFNLKASGDKGTIIDRLYSWLINPKEVSGSDESKAQRKTKSSLLSSKKSKAPRKKSARDIFMNEKRSLYRAMEEHKSKNRVDIDKILSEAWKGVSAEEKKEFEEKAKEENIKTGKTINKKQSSKKVKSSETKNKTGSDRISDEAEKVTKVSRKRKSANDDKDEKSGESSKKSKAATPVEVSPGVEKASKSSRKRKTLGESGELVEDQDEQHKSSSSKKIQVTDPAIENKRKRGKN
ncbi:13139_t:CDS:2 [Entrophospora sp. SA101]|nr:13139_t:CDS:2 [Entrophospora sp. SA101]CAJ0886847.1 983_t:CDS:2 [Entrophospora sp. SA101]